MFSLEAVFDHLAGRCNAVRDSEKAKSYSDISVGTCLPESLGYVLVIRGRRLTGEPLYGIACL